MNTSTVTVSALFRARPGKEQELRAQLSALLEPTRREAGCLNYDLHVSADDPAKLFMHENWTSREHIESHFHSAHVQAFVPRVDGLCAEPPQITMWQRIG